MKVTVVVATHKPYAMPADPLYLPLHVGAEGKESIGFAGDNTGDHISAKNPQFCELTGLYWAWKNVDADYIGLAHYRRHFRGKGRGEPPTVRCYRWQSYAKPFVNRLQMQTKPFASIRFFTLGVVMFIILLDQSALCLQRMGLLGKPQTKRVCSSLKVGSIN